LYYFITNCWLNPVFSYTCWVKYGARTKGHAKEDTKSVLFGKQKFWAKLKSIVHRSLVPQICCCCWWWWWCECVCERNVVRSCWSRVSALSMCRNLLIVGLEGYLCPWSHSDTPHSVGLPWKKDQPVAETSI
jgi:hypothetical protein